MQCLCRILEKLLDNIGPILTGWSMYLVAKEKIKSKSSDSDKEKD